MDPKGRGNKQKDKKKKKKSKAGRSAGNAGRATGKSVPNNLGKQILPTVCKKKHGKGMDTLGRISNMIARQQVSARCHIGRITQE